MIAIANKTLEEILDKHALWLKDESSGKRAYLNDANLNRADLSGIKYNYLLNITIRSSMRVYHMSNLVNMIIS